MQMTATKIDDQKDAVSGHTWISISFRMIYLPAIKDRDRAFVYEAYRGFGPGAGIRRPSFFDRDG
jgi:hypothetical protein